MKLRVCHVSPTCLGLDGRIGGGERFAEELARAMAERARVKLISFGTRERRERPGRDFERVILESRTDDPMTPFSLELFHELRGADVIHCHQYFVLPTFLAALQGRLQRSRVFVSDLGGGGWTPGYQIDQSRWITAHLPISRYAARSLPGRNQRHHVITGGVDAERYAMRATLDHDGSIVFLGRILPHKGIHHLIEALPPGKLLRVIGPATDAEYLRRLERLGTGKDVQFLHHLDDAAVIATLQRAMALVHPTPIGEDGSAGANELFGLALVEAMACGCPVIATAAASLPEIVEDGRTGWLVPPADAAALRQAIRRVSGDRPMWRNASVAARQRVEDEFTWGRVAERCLSIYAAPTTELSV